MGGLIPALTSGKIDAIIAGMSQLQNVRRASTFRPLLYVRPGNGSQKGGKYDGATSIQDFKGAKITAQLNTFHYTVIDQIEGVLKQTAMDDFRYEGCS